MKAMNKILTSIFSAALALSLVVGIPGAAWANNDGTDTYYRVNDYVGLITSDQELSLSDAVKEEVVNLQFDFVVYITDNSGDATSLAKQFYQHNNCGFSQDDDGIILCLKNDGTAGVFVDGLGSVIFSDLVTSQLATDALVDTISDGTYQACYNFLQKAITKVAKYRGVDASSRWPAAESSNQGASSGSSSGAASGASSASSGAAATTGHTTDELDWYPKDPSSFKDFHNETASRVVDNADLLTDEQEAQLAASIADMTARTGLDFVLCTDNTSYGLSRGLYAADFYQFNGYGLGSEYSGVIYFVCMEKGNRGFWTAARGTARKLLTEANVNKMDDVTYDMFVDGDYGKAILSQFAMLDDLYSNGEITITEQWANEEFMDLLKGFGAFGLLVSIIIGIVVGLKALGVKKAAMKTVAEASDARRYSGGLALSKRSDNHYNTEITRTKHVEPDNDSDSGSSGGGSSSYSSSYSSSGGASFSGGGRSF